MVFRWSSQKLILLRQQQIRNSVLEKYTPLRICWGQGKEGIFSKGSVSGPHLVSAGHEGVQSPGNRRRQEISSQHQFSMLLKAVSFQILPPGHPTCLLLEGPLGSGLQCIGRDRGLNRRMEFPFDKEKPTFIKSVDLLLLLLKFLWFPFLPKYIFFY